MNLSQRLEDTGTEWVSTTGYIAYDDDYCIKCGKCRKCNPNYQQHYGSWHVVNTPITTTPDLFKDTEFYQRKNNLIKDMDKFLDNLDSTYKDRDKMRDKVKEFIRDERKHVASKVTC